VPFQKSGQRMKCSACQLVAHHNCIPFVNEKSTLACKPTYRDVGIRQYREQTTTHHHWVHRKLEKGKCKQCGKVGWTPTRNTRLFCFSYPFRTSIFFLIILKNWRDLKN